MSSLQDEYLEVPRSHLYVQKARHDGLFYPGESYGEDFQKESTLERRGCPLMSFIEKIIESCPRQFINGITRRKVGAFSKRPHS